MALRSGAFELVTSPALLAALDEVLRRPKLRAYVTPEEATAFGAFIRRESRLVDDPPPSAVASTDDPGDEHLIDLARASRVDALVSGDPHLLRARSRLPIESPRAFLDSLGDV